MSDAALNVKLNGNMDRRDKMKYYLLTHTIYSFDADSDEEAIKISEESSDMNTESESFITLTSENMRLIKDYQ